MVGLNTIRGLAAADSATAEGEAEEFIMCMVVVLLLLLLVLFVWAAGSYFMLIPLY